MTCSKCSSQHIIPFNRLRHFLLLSTLPILFALIIGWMVHVVFFLCIPLVLFINLIVVRKKPLLYICQACRFSWAANPK